MTSAFSDTPCWLCQPFVIFYSFSLSLVVQWWDVICGRSLNPTKWGVDNVSRLLGEGARRVRCEVVRPVVPACRANTVLFSTFSTKISTRILPHLSSWVNSLTKLYRCWLGWWEIGHFLRHHVGNKKIYKLCRKKMLRNKGFFVLKKDYKIFGFWCPSVRKQFVTIFTPALPHPIISENKYLI